MKETDRHALVTGASGFIGSHLCRKLIADGCAVHAITRGDSIPTDAGEVELHRGDLADAVFVRSVVEQIRPQYVFHLASAVTGSRDVQAVLPTLSANLIAAVNLMTALVGSGCRRLVLAGSQEEPDWGSSEIPCSPYAAGKWAASGYARMFHELYGLPVITARIFMVYGPAQRDRTKIVPYMIESLLDGNAPKLSSGLRPVDWIHVDDVVEGLIACALAGAVGETVELGSGELVTIRGMVETMVSILQPTAQPQFGAVPDRPLERTRCADVVQAERKTGWQPKIRLEDGLRRTIDWHRRQRSGA